MKNIKRPSIERIHKTEAYDVLEAFCDDDKGGESDFMLCDKYDRQQVVNLLYPIIRKEIIATADNNDLKKPCPRCSGSGWKPNVCTPTQCYTCRGKGYL